MPTDHSDYARAWSAAQPAVAAWLGSLVRDAHAVDDLVQEVAVRAWRRWGDYDHRRPFVAWALGIARFVWLEWLRTRPTQVALSDPAALDALTQAGTRMQAELSARAVAMHGCLAEVEGRGAEVLRRRYELDEKPAEIADHLGLSAGNVRIILHRLRAALKDCIERRLAGGRA